MRLTKIFMAIFAPDERLPSSATLISCENYLWANDDDDGDDIDGGGGDDIFTGDPPFPVATSTAPLMTLPTKSILR